MGEVRNLGAYTKLPLRPERILGAAYDQAVANNLGTAIVLGWEGDDSKGDLYFASSEEQLGEILILLECARDEIMSKIARQRQG